MNNYISYDWYRNAKMNSFPNMNLFAPKESYEKGQPVLVGTITIET